MSGLIEAKVIRAIEVNGGHASLSEIVSYSNNRSLTKGAIAAAMSTMLESGVIAVYTSERTKRRAPRYRLAKEGESNKFGKDDIDYLAMKSAGRYTRAGQRIRHLGSVESTKGLTVEKAGVVGEHLVIMFEGGSCLILEACDCDFLFPGCDQVPDRVLGEFGIVG